MKEKSLTKTNQTLIKDIIHLIEQGKRTLAVTVNSGMTYLYWKIGQRVNEEVLNNERAKYGKQILVTLSRELTDLYDKGFDEANLRRMTQFAQMFNNEEILVTLSRELSWSHFVSLITIKDELQREFYIQICRVEKWSVRILRQKIDSMLFERTAISKKPEKLIKQELELLRDENHLTPDLIFKDPYFLNFVGLKNT